ncbi:hypothetical protein K525DRAFT_261781 [Schizophyllum commune Loenen D]|nr:hypothetical protein K525DRAFT_261781 [Schizophyllum commune Loenen D]
MRDLAVQIIEEEAEDEPRFGFHCDGTGCCPRCKEAPSIVGLPSTMSMMRFNENVALLGRSCLPTCLLDPCEIRAESYR